MSEDELKSYPYQITVRVGAMKRPMIAQHLRYVAMHIDEGMDQGSLEGLDSWDFEIKHHGRSNGPQKQEEVKNQ
jgi:hypothetical protein